VPSATTSRARVTASGRYYIARGFTDRELTPFEEDQLLLGCSAHWFDEHPTYRNGGLVALGYYEHGTRFLDIQRNGKIKEWAGSCPSQAPPPPLTG
jgi:hypothetical protein